MYYLHYSFALFFLSYTGAYYLYVIDVIAFSYMLICNNVILSYKVDGIKGIKNPEVQITIILLDHLQSKQNSCWPVL